MFQGPKLTLDSSLLETEQSHTQSFSTSHGGLEEEKEQPVTSAATSSSKDGEARVASAVGVCAVLLVEVHSLTVANVTADEVCW